MDAPYKSDIPPDVEEKRLTEYKREGHCIWPKKTACWRNGEIVGERSYEQDGTLIIETPLKNGKKHGVEYYWEEDGSLSCAEPYEDGLLHGTAFQWDPHGNVVGTYTLHRGTGYDIWRSTNEDGTIVISEIHSLKGGFPHGFEWWVKDDQQSVHMERHWHEGMLHGIERHWDDDGRLLKGYPKYWIQDAEVSHFEYMEQLEKDSQLPSFKKRDRNCIRKFPEEIQQLL